jgi:hypothetical protein
MNIYQMRVLNPLDAIAKIYTSSHISDFAAIRRAMSMANAGDLIEVWRGVVCVFSGVHNSALAF